MPRIELYAFRYRNPRTGKWTTARYSAEPREIAARYVDFELLGPPEIRDVDPEARYFNPHIGAVPVGHRSVVGPSECQLPAGSPLAEDPAKLDAFERFLMLLFLRRYVTYCARRQRFAAMNGAARLYADLAAGVRHDPPEPAQRGSTA